VQQGNRAVRLAYQPPANSIFLSDKPATSNQPAVLFSQNKPAPAISHQPNEQVENQLRDQTRPKCIALLKVLY
jgi:hypothetical protein